MKVAIVSDSNSGITQAEAKELGIHIVPMPFTIEGEEYFEDINLSQESFYNKLLQDVSVSTSQPSIGLVMSLWDDLLKEFDQIVYIPMSSGLSESCASALRVAEVDYKGKVFVVDNQRISVTQKQSVLDAIELANKGYNGQEIHDILMKVKMHSDIYIMVDTLKYLRKGGRITPAAAAVGGLLKIKPVLRIFGEKLDKYRMMNRTLENAKRIMIEAAKNSIEGFLKDIDGRTDNVHLSVAYTGTDNSVALEFVELVKKEFKVENVVCNPLSLSVSCHIGDGALAIAMSKALSEELLK
ncbi:DegV family protein [Thomasclavelia cocleata]|jgi:DegV family protein with EDD domain|uniref:DegV family protein n=1 Tax=Thomasclavelia cocleata TaxID=69824 RepID=UPI002572B9E5|nr:DegV family protein [Thomasclavelia cocleata]MCI9654179.1 DegV family protein [Acholeplasmatales bacterium]